MTAKKTTARRDGPGIRRLRAAPNAETIRADVLTDQQTGRRKARARIDAKAAQTPAGGPAAAARPRRQPPPAPQSQRRDFSEAFLSRLRPSRRLLRRWPA